MSLSAICSCSCFASFLDISSCLLIFASSDFLDPFVSDKSFSSFLLIFLDSFTCELGYRHLLCEYISFQFFVLFDNFSILVVKTAAFDSNSVAFLSDLAQPLIFLMRSVFV